MFWFQDLRFRCKFVLTFRNFGWARVRRQAEAAVVETEMMRVLQGDPDPDSDPGDICSEVLQSTNKSIIPMK